MKLTFTRHVDTKDDRDTNIINLKRLFVLTNNHGKSNHNNETLIESDLHKVNLEEHGGAGHIQNEHIIDEAMVTENNVGNSIDINKNVSFEEHGGTGNILKENQIDETIETQNNVDFNGGELESDDEMCAYEKLRARNNEGEFDKKDSLVVDARPPNRDSLDKS